MELKDVNKTNVITDPTYTLNEVAEFINVKPCTVRNLVKSGKLKAVNRSRTGRQFLLGFLAKDIQEYYDNIPDSAPRLKILNK